MFYRFLIFLRPGRVLRGSSRMKSRPRTHSRCSDGPKWPVMSSMFLYFLRLVLLISNFFPYNMATGILFIWSKPATCNLAGTGSSSWQKMMSIAKDDAARIVPLPDNHVPGRVACSCWNHMILLGNKEPPFRDHLGPPRDILFAKFEYVPVIRGWILRSIL